MHRHDYGVMIGLDVRILAFLGIFSLGVFGMYVKIPPQAASKLLLLGIKFLCT